MNDPKVQSWSIKRFGDQLYQVVSGESAELIAETYREDNANLIRTAPELVVTLSDVHDEFLLGTTEQERQLTIVRIESVLARARGRA